MVKLSENNAKMVVYKARDGQDVTLSIDIIRNYLVTGRKDLVTIQEIIYFMGVCKSRGLNPFARDCYLIKYTESDPAAIVTSIDFYRSRARAQADCTGWEKGVICLNEQTGELRYSKGLVLPGEKLIGGWFRAKPKGWEVPFELEVNLEGYIKRTKDGKITQFWAPEKQATMIAKVAESQGLRALWPDEFRGTVTAEEANIQIDHIETIDTQAAPEPEPEVDASEFDRLVNAKAVDADQLKRLHKFIEECAAANSRKNQSPVTPIDIKLKAFKDFDRFWTAFESWEAKQIKQEILPATDLQAENQPVSLAPAASDLAPESPNHESLPLPEQPVSKRSKQRDLGHGTTMQ